jgi:hypothetical protein
MGETASIRGTDSGTSRVVLARPASEPLGCPGTSDTLLGVLDGRGGDGTTARAASSARRHDQDHPSRSHPARPLFARTLAPPGDGLARQKGLDGSGSAHAPSKFSAPFSSGPRPRSTPPAERVRVGDGRFYAPRGGRWRGGEIRWPLLNQNDRLMFKLLISLTSTSFPKFESYQAA